MGDAGDCPDSPPLPRGTYNFNFDDLDDSVDPFKPRGGLGFSPDKDIGDPFKSKSKLSSSPPKQSKPISVKKTKKKVKAQKDESLSQETVTDERKSENGEHQINGPDLNTEDPFKSKNMLAHSPPADDSKENPFETKTKLAQSPPSESFMGEEDPFKSTSMLSRSPVGNETVNENNSSETKSEAAISSPVDIVEDNPFATKAKVSNSPSRDSYISEDDPFKSESKLARSPGDESFSGENPFQSKTKLGRSPPNSETSMQGTVVNTNENVDEGFDQQPVQTESLGTGSKGLKTRAKSATPPVTVPQEDTDQTQPPNDQDGGSDFSQPKPVKKTTSPKKSGLKKPKAKSKLKPPANFGAQETDDVEIFAPPPPAQNTRNVEDIDSTSSQSAAELTEGRESQTTDYQEANEMTTSEMIGRPSGMIDSVHDFGAAEMPIDSNEDFVPQSEAFGEDEAWETMQNAKYEHGAKGRESLEAFDPLTDRQVPDKVTVTRRISDAGIDGDSVNEDDDLLLMNTPPSHKQASSRPRHPAARALQEHVEGDGAPKEAHVIDKMLFSPVKGEEGKQPAEFAERYFDAPEYPIGSNPKGDTEVERLNAANKKYGGDLGQENIVQLVQVLRYSQSDWNKMKQELELDFNARLLNKEREWTKKLADRDKKISFLEDQILTLRSSNDDMKCVVTEFEKTIAQLQEEKEKTTSESQQSYEEVVKERDQALEDLQSVETAFSDLHQRYERTKGVVENFKKNEDVLKKCVQDYQARLKTAEEKGQSVRQQAEEKLAHAREEMEKLTKSNTSEVARLEAAIKKAELKIQGLERSLEQKVQENSELTAICDELIAKVGGD